MFCSFKNWCRLKEQTRPSHFHTNCILLRCEFGQYVRSSPLSEVLGESFFGFTVQERWWRTCFSNMLNAPLQSDFSSRGVDTRWSHWLILLHVLHVSDILNVNSHISTPNTSQSSWLRVLYQLRESTILNQAHIKPRLRNPASSLSFSFYSWQKI